MGAEVAVVSGVLSAVGVGMQVFGQTKQTQATSDASEASQRAEEARRQQMLLESARQQRETIRKMQAARAAAIDNASSQGASAGSGVQGGIASITNQGYAALNQTDRATAIGNNIFDANKDYAAAQSRAAIGSGIAGLGRTLALSSTQLAKDGATLFSAFSPTNTTPSYNFANQGYGDRY